MRRSLALAVCAVALVPAGVSAQFCRGLPSLNTNIANVGVSASFFDEGKGFGAEAQFGNRLFFEGAFNYIDFDTEGADLSLSLKTLGAGIGYEVTEAAAPVSVCPGVVVEYGFGLEVFGIDFTAVQVAPGVSVGLVSEVSSTVTVAPFAEAALVWAHVMVDAGPFGEGDESETFGTLGLGIGVAFNDALNVRPSVSFPISEEDGNTLFTVLVSLPIGR